MGNGRSNSSRVRRSMKSCLQEDQTLSYQQPLLDPITQKERQMYEQQQEEKPLDLEALIHQLNSFFAVVWPVVITILLASLVACTVTDKTTQHAMSAYMYYQNIESNTSMSTSVKTLHALMNGLIVIGLIACLTFGIVLLYKFNCIKIFHGYCILYSTLLLGLSGSKLIGLILFHKTNSQLIILDQFTFLFLMYNFALVGTWSIFYQKGIPTFIEQAYLVFTSVIVAWQLCQLPEWSIWALLLLLALWDLFAVLSPMGPLRWLIQLIHEKGTPLPGLLFEANINQHGHLGEKTTSSQTSSNPTRLTYNGPTTTTTKAIVRRTLDLKITEERFLYDYLLKDKAQEIPKIQLDQMEMDTRIQLFKNQLSHFLQDVDSSFLILQLDELLIPLYVQRQQVLWRRLYLFFHVQFVPCDKKYPQVQDILVPNEEEDQSNSSIKLGLGDFIFYSVLAGRAALHGMTVFSVCLMNLIMGLAITMYLLAQYEALPALPIPIFLAIGSFFLATWIICPMLDQIVLEGGIIIW